MNIKHSDKLQKEKLEYTIPNFSFNFYYLLKQLLPEGHMVYEYNPFRNYRLSGNRDSEGYIEGEDKEYNPDDKEITEAGSIVDLDTKHLKFNLSKPITITCQPSYDGSTNLIMNDGANMPRLINSRFSALPMNTYKIVDRAGNNDTNLYDSAQFELDTSLYKRIDSIPNILFNGIGYGGNFKVGNYVFYFKLSDADGNETDFVGESSIVTCHIGNINDPNSIRGGIGDENSYKSVSFTLTNIDSSYDYITVYYTRSTSDIDGIESVSAHKFNKMFPMSNLSCNLLLTGSESIQNITLDEINTGYFIADKVATQAPCQNIMFFGNIHKASIDYTELADLSLRILPYYQRRESRTIIGSLKPNYIEEYFVNTPYEYYNTKNIYNHIGYWNEEIYRLGVVWLMPDNTLSPVFNIRGLDKIPYRDENTDIASSYTHESVYIVKDGKRQRNYIKINENYRIGQKSDVIENSKGVIRIYDKGSIGGHQLYNLGFAVDHAILEELKGKVKGFFIVRQKRIPNILAQALTMGFDQNSGIPIIHVNDNERYIESFINKYGTLTNTYKERLYNTYRSNNTLSSQLNASAICPEFNVKQPFFNNLFTGTKFTYRESIVNTERKELVVDNTYERHYYIKDYTKSDKLVYKNIEVTGLGDNTPVIRDNYYSYRARAGEAEEAFKFRSIGGDFSTSYGDNTSNNIVRGSFGPYLAISGYRERPNTLINIYIPDYDEIYTSRYFSSRYEDNSAYYPITDRLSISVIEDLTLATVESEDLNQEGIRSHFLDNIYRGDCFICNYTHRLNRNFQDTEAPNNDEIVDPNTFKDNYTKGDSEKNGKINRGDVNAVQLGSWITFKVYSNSNLSMRNWNDSYVSESGLTGSNRTFYPLSAMSVEGNTKIPESFVINTGESSTTSDKYNFVLPDVPYIKNEFGTRIIYSDKAVNDAFKNGFRVFQSNHYRDYPMIYGGIIKLIELYGNLLCVFEHGVALIPVNERAVAGEGSGGNVYINTSNVLPENPKMLSDMFGSQWSESVIKTPYYVYGIDTVAKKVWRTNGENFEVISDFKIQKFLNDNITLSERELTPVIGIRNVKTHYNAFKGDVMFTFYDNLYGFEEKAWNICYNEIMQKWITLYSWIPSYSENIDNIPFSFNRNTSKWIAKLGTTSAVSTNADGITLDNVVLSPDKMYGVLGLTNRALPNSAGTNLPNVHFEYSIEKSNFGNEKYFKIRDLEYVDGEKLSDRTERIYKELISKIYNPAEDIEKTRETAERLAKSEATTKVLHFEYYYKEDEGHNMIDDIEKNYELLSTKEVWQLNMKVDITIEDSKDDNIKKYINGWREYTSVNYGYYQSVIAVTSDAVLNNPMLTEEEKASPNLTTDFWKHGQSGIIDIKEKIRPCYWYGEQHPFEFEYVVVDKPGTHKIFTNLQLISNKAKPESFHYEIVGESYDWANDKKNMYVRQEVTKKLYQNLGSDILYNRNFEDLVEGKYVIVKGDINEGQNPNGNYLVYKPKGIKCNVKSTIFPWYYERIDTFNEIYDSYQAATSEYKRDYQNLSGTEVIYDEQLNEFRLCTHSKACDMKEIGRLRGNCQYQEDLWLVVIPSINFRQKNENWAELPPIVLNNIPNDIKEDNITKESLPKFN